eukprot:COSAG02_NODE_17770_length_982_cov_0.986410_1_plen_65_part_10
MHVQPTPEAVTKETAAGRRAPRVLLVIATATTDISPLAYTPAVASALPVCAIDAVRGRRAPRVLH